MPPKLQKRLVMGKKVPNTCTGVPPEIRPSGGEISCKVIATEACTLAHSALTERCESAYRRRM